MTMQIAARKTQEAAFADKGLVYWSTKSCQQCHGADLAHQALGWKLGVDRSVWTDGHHASDRVRELGASGLFSGNPNP